MSKSRNAIKKDAIKYVLGIAMLAALIAVWSCAEEEGGIIPPEGFVVGEDSGEPMELNSKQRSLVFQDDGIPLQNVLDNAGFTVDAREYQWIAHIDTYFPSDEDYDNGITQFLMKKPETPFYIGIRAGQLGNDAELVVLYNDNVEIVTQALTDNAYSSAATEMPTEAAWGRESLDLSRWNNDDLPDNGLTLFLEVYLGTGADDFNWESSDNYRTGSTFFNGLLVSHIQFTLRQSNTGVKSLELFSSDRATPTDDSANIVASGITFSRPSNLNEYRLYPYDTEMLLLEYSRITD